MEINKGHVIAAIIGALFLLSYVVVFMAGAVLRDYPNIVYVPKETIKEVTIPTEISVDTSDMDLIKINGKVMREP